jgi:hypothetical protein
VWTLTLDRKCKWEFERKSTKIIEPHLDPHIPLGLKVWVIQTSQASCAVPNPEKDISSRMERIGCNPFHESLLNNLSFVFMEGIEPSLCCLWRSSSFPDWELHVTFARFV